MQVNFLLSVKLDKDNRHSWGNIVQQKHFFNQKFERKFWSEKCSWNERKKCIDDRKVIEGMTVPNFPTLLITPHRAKKIVLQTNLKESFPQNVEIFTCYILLKKCFRIEVIVIPAMTTQPLLDVQSWPLRNWFRSKNEKNENVSTFNYRKRFNNSSHELDVD